MVGHNCPSCRQLGKKLSSQQKQVNEEGSGGNSKSGECFIKLLLLHSTPRPSQILQLNWKSLHRVGWGTWLTFPAFAVFSFHRLDTASYVWIVTKEPWRPAVNTFQKIASERVQSACIHSKNGSPGSPYSAESAICLAFWGSSSAKWIRYIHACRAIAIYRIV